MQTHTFTYKEVFGQAWNKTKEHAWYIFRVFLLSAIIMGAGRFLFILSPIIDFIVGIAIITVSLVIVENKTPTFHDLLKSFQSYKITWRYFVSSIYSILIIMGGTILFIIPGIYLATRIQFYKFIIIDNEHIKPWDSIKKSMEITRGHFWKLFGFVLLIVIMNILGALLLGIGLLVTVPISILAHAYLYKKLSTHTTNTANISNS